MKQHRWQLLVFLATLVVAFVLAEVAFRAALFSTNDAFKTLREAGAYSDDSSESDFWKLYYLFGGKLEPFHPHPLLGWVGDFQPRTLMHNHVGEVGHRRPVLLYGDSHAQCLPQVECFQAILNHDLAFASDHYLLNYGVGGYGVDQTALLFANSVHRFERPFVIFSLMVEDLDRTLLSVRFGQKPHFAVEGGSLVLKGVPVEANPADFFRENPPQIRSYLWRRFLYARVNGVPAVVDRWLKGEKRRTAEKIDLNGRILDAVVDDLRRSRLDFFFVVFPLIRPGDPAFAFDREDNWRDLFLRRYLEERKIPHIWSKDLIRQDPSFHGDNLDLYIILANGHPTTHFNRLIAEKMKEKLSEVEALAGGALSSQPGRDETGLWYATMIRTEMERARTTPDRLARAREMAARTGCSEEEALRDDAVRTIGQSEPLYSLRWPPAQPARR
jgi:hypothetical protein